MIPQINTFNDEKFVVSKNQLIRYTGEDNIVVIPEGIEDIGKGCFEGNLNLEKITLPNSLKIISRNAFLGCANLNEIVFGENLSDIGAKAFMDCSMLKTLDIPSKLCSLGKNILTGTGVFNDKKNWYNGMLVIDNCVFEVDKDIEGTCIIPDECSTIAQYAFKDCEKIESVYMPDSVITIGKHAFEGCTNLKHIILSENITDIPKSCFKNCGKLLNVEIPNNVNILRVSSFVNCTSLRNIIIPVNVREICGTVFQGCSNLKNILILNKGIEISGGFIPSDIDATIRCLPNSSALQYAISKNIKFSILDNKYTSNGEVNAKISQKYISIINKIYYDYETVTHEDISIIKGMCNRCIKHDQRDWKATWDCIGRPDRDDLNSFVEDALLVRDELREFKYEALLVFRKKYFNILSLAYRNLSSMDIDTEEYSTQEYQEDFNFDMREYYEVNGIDYTDVYISYIDEPIKRKICKQLSEAIRNLLVVKDYENIIQVYKRQLELISDNFQSFFSKFQNEYINFFETYLNDDERIFNECLEYAAFIESKNYSNDEKYTYYYSCGIFLKKRENFKLAMDFLEKALEYSNGNSEKVIEKINSCKNGKIKLIQQLFVKYESGEQSVFDGVAEVKIEDSCIYVDNCLMAVDRNTSGTFYIKDFCEYIGPEAFSECKFVSEIACPSGLKSIGSEAFYCCEKLEKINIPETVSTIGSHAFSGCISLKNIVLPMATTHISDGLFEYCSKLESIKIPDSVEKISEDAFVGCNSLKTISIPKKVNEIKKYAFFMCENLKLIDINSEKIDIGEGNFDNILEDKWCESVKIIGYENSGADTFANENYFEFESKGVSEYEDFNLKKDILRKYQGCKEIVYIPSSVSVIGDEAFKNSPFVKEVIIPDNVSKICLESFCGCKRLQNIKFPNHLKKIDTSAFSGCIQLANVELPEGLDAIYENAFENCTNLKEITIPKSVRIMKPNIFKGCSSELVIKGSYDSEARLYAERYFIKFMEINEPEVNLDIEKDEEISKFILPATETIDRVSYNNIDVKEDDIDDFMSDLI